MGIYLKNLYVAQCFRISVYLIVHSHSTISRNLHISYHPRHTPCLPICLKRSLIISPFCGNAVRFRNVRKLEWGSMELVTGYFVYKQLLPLLSTLTAPFRINWCVPSNKTRIHRDGNSANLIWKCAITEQFSLIYSRSVISNLSSGLLKWVFII